MRYTEDQILRIITEINYNLMKNGKDFRLNLAEYLDTSPDLPEMIHVLEIGPTGDMAVIHYMSGSLEYVLDELVRGEVLTRTSANTIVTLETFVVN